MYSNFFIYFFILAHTFVLIVQGQIQAASRRYTITEPTANSLYVAGQIVPVTYTIPDDPNLTSILGLAVYFTTRDTSVPFFQAAISNDADLSQGFSFRHTTSTEVYYEHQLNYDIPKETPAGNYQIVFVDTKGGAGNTSVPIVVRPYSPSTGTSSTATTKPAQVSNVFLHENSATLSSLPIVGTMNFVWLFVLGCFIPLV